MDGKVMTMLWWHLWRLRSGSRAAAAAALGRIGDLRALKPLVEALKDPDAQPRVAAAAALGRIGDLRARASLVAALEDEVEYVRAAAAQALKAFDVARGSNDPKGPD